MLTFSFCMSTCNLSMLTCNYNYWCWHAINVDIIDISISHVNINKYHLACWKSHVAIFEFFLIKYCRFLIVFNITILHVNILSLLVDKFDRKKIAHKGLKMPPYNSFYMTLEWNINKMFLNVNSYTFIASCHIPHI